MRDEQFGYQLMYSTSLRLALLLESITRDFGEKRLTGAVFRDVTKTFDTILFDGLLYKLTFLNFPSYLVNTTS
jgi:16S rRNA C1402 (ribose-2'-O) methylase RsmI